MSASSEAIDLTRMLDGVSKLLGREPYETKEAREDCKHEDDYHEYARTTKYVTRRCNKCGVYYDELINAQ